MHSHPPGVGAFYFTENGDSIYNQKGTMIYLKNITRTQSLMIPRSEGTTIVPASEAVGDNKTTYTSAEIDARLAAIRNEKLDKDSLRKENWNFTLDDGSVVEKEVALWNGEESQM